MQPKPTQYEEELADEEFLMKLFQLADLAALELVPTDQGTCLIPYMLSDAVEDYYVLRGAVVQGFDGKIGPTAIRPEPVEVSSDGRLGIIFRQESGETAAVWYDRAEHVREYYQYHRTGHFWVDGQEYWRRLVYIAGSVSEKLEYLGSEALNPEEHTLAALMGYAPFRYWSPVETEFPDGEPETQEGYLAMQKMAEEAGDLKFLKEMDRFSYLPYKMRIRRLANLLVKPERDKLYRRIDQLASRASKFWPERSYPREDELYYQQERDRTDRLLKKKGWQGSYPCYEKNGKKIRALEEHPYVRFELEYDRYRFRITILEETWPHRVFRSIEEVSG